MGEGKAAWRPALLALSTQAARRPGGKASLLSRWLVKPWVPRFPHLPAKALPSPGQRAAALRTPGEPPSRPRWEAVALHAAHRGGHTSVLLASFTNHQGCWPGPLPPRSSLMSPSRSTQMALQSELLSSSSGSGSAKGNGRGPLPLEGRCCQGRRVATARHWGPACPDLSYVCTESGSVASPGALSLPVLCRKRPLSKAPGTGGLLPRLVPWSSAPQAWEASCPGWCPGALPPEGREPRELLPPLSWCGGGPPGTNGDMGTVAFSQLVLQGEAFRAPWGCW